MLEGSADLGLVIAELAFGDGEILAGLAGLGVVAVGQADPGTPYPIIHARF
jgi:hypothetical protein